MGLLCQCAGEKGGGGGEVSSAHYSLRLTGNRKVASVFTVNATLTAIDEELVIVCGL